LIDKVIPVIGEIEVKKAHNKPGKNIGHTERGGGEWLTIVGHT
jgi:hypothetical protein